MATGKIFVDIKGIQGKIDKTVAKGLGDAMQYLKKKVEDKTPEDTKRLVGTYEIEPIKVGANSITSALKNKTEYAVFVEYGVRGRDYNYNKPKGKIFYRGEGARMITRTADQEANEVAKIIEGA